MASVSSIAVLLVLAAAIGREDGFHAVRVPHKYDTPQIAGSPYRVHQQDRPQPPRIVPGPVDAGVWLEPPSDAEVLFDGRSLDRFRATKWTVNDQVIVAGEGSLITKTSYGDCQLHVEWRTPSPRSGPSMSSGNSGVFFMQRYELQIFDSYSCRIYADGSAGAIYGQTPPKVNACRPPGEWQTYDVHFTAPVFQDDSVVEPAQITVLHNGVFIHSGTTIKGPTRHKEAFPYKRHPSRQPILFQGHHSPVEFRNVWVRDLSLLNDAN